MAQQTGRGSESNENNKPEHLTINVDNPVYNVTRTKKCLNIRRNIPTLNIPSMIFTSTFLKKRKLLVFELQ